MEITHTAKLTASKGGVSVSNATSVKTQAMESTLTHMQDTVQSVGTSFEDILSGDVDLTKQHFLLFRNTDPTNFVTVQVCKDVSNAAVAGIMLPGEFCNPGRVSAQTAGYPKYQLKADTAVCNVEVVITEAGTPGV